MKGKLENKILSISLTLMMVFSVLFGVLFYYSSKIVVTETEANVRTSLDNMDITGNYKYIYYNSYWNSGDDICKFYDGSSGAISYDLYCAQRGGSIGSAGAKYKEVVWNENAEIWISEDCYKKITWIKDNFWEKEHSSEGYSIAEKTQILQKVDSSITEDDVRSVFEDNYKRYKIYQYITWTYVKGDEVPTWRLSQGAEKKIYDAIVELASRNYQNANDYKLKIETQEGHYDGEGPYNYVWPVTITNTSPLDYSLELRVDGNVINQDGYEFSNGNIVIKNLDSLNHNFEVYARTHYVKSMGTVWYNVSKQKFIEITRTNDIVLEDRASTLIETTGNYNLNIRKVDEDGNNVSGATFKVNDIELTASTNVDGIVGVENSRAIESQNSTYNYRISEVSSGGTLSKIKNDVTITLKSGIKKKNDNSYCYVIADATFDENGKDTYVAETESGIKVTLRLENNFSEETGITTVTLVVPNSKKIYDLALTKTMILPISEMSEFDLNKDGVVNTLDSNFIRRFKKEDGTEESDMDKYARYNNKIEEHYPDAYNKYYKYLIDSSKQSNEKYKPIYEDIWNTIEKISKKELPNRSNDDLENAGQELQQLSATIGAGADIDRINNISDYELKNNQDITTATYNMNKTTRKIKNNPQSPSIITYKITIYNEGDYDSKDIEITDYLPDGLVVCDKNGNTDLVDGKIICEYGTKAYEWTVSGNKVKTTVNDTIEGYTKEYKLNSRSVYIYCKLDGSTPSGTVLYNVAEISNSTPLDFQGNEINVVDRDSDEDSIEEDTQNNVITSYKNRFEEQEHNSNSSRSNKNTYEYEDDDDFERIVIADSEFDLSLRKSITKRGTDEQNMEIVYGNGTSNEGENRLPKLNEVSAQYCANTGTGWYVHGKTHVIVSANDYVEYTIRAYNEGGQDDYVGYASQITDYLPENLEFIAVVNCDESWVQDATDGKYITTNNNLGHYEVTYDSNNKKVVIDYKNPVKLNTRNYLKDIALFDDSNMQTYYNIGNESVSEFTYGYQEVRIICKVSQNAPVMKNITNIAEITREVALEIDGSEVNISDRDSNPNSIVVESDEVNLDTYYENKNIDDIHNEYYPGIQDDDDFETVYLNPVFEDIQYKIQARKVDSAGNALNDATFSLVKGSSNENLFGNGGAVDNSGWTSEHIETVSADTIKQKYENGMTVIRSDPYTLKEETAPEGYSKLSSAIYLQYELGITNNSGTISAMVNNVTVAIPGANSVVLNSSNRSGTIENVLCENEMVADINVSLDEYGKISIVVENPKFEEGKYSVKLIKKNPDGNEMPGVQFSASAKINGENITIATAENPIVTQRSAVRIGEEVTIETDQTGEGKDDIYTLKEESVGEANSGEYYVGIPGNIIINVSKKSVDNGSTITNSVENVTLSAMEGATLSDDGKTLTFENGAKVTVTYTGTVVTVTVTNPKKEIEGSYKVQLIKKKTNGEVMADVEFSATAVINGENKIIATAEQPIVTGVEPVNLGEEVTIGTEQTGEGKDDVYTLKEENIGNANKDTYYIGITGDIVLNVSKQSVDSGSKITNSVKDVTIRKMEGATLSDDGKTLTFTNGSEVKVSYENGIVTIIVTNPEKGNEGSYKVQLIKKDIDGNKLAGVQFSATAVINGESNIIATAEQPIVTSETPVDVGHEVTIETEQTGEGKDDIYTLKEEYIGDENKNKYYIGIDGNIVLNVSKKSVDNGSTITNSVKNVSLGEMEGATLSDDGKTLTFTNGSEVTVVYENGIITITVTNPYKTGNFKLNIKKTAKGSNPVKPLEGAGFKVSIKNGDVALVDGDGNTLDGTHEYFVNNSGELVIDGLNIESEGLTYDVVISESTVPAGYIGIGEDITYTAVSTTKNNQLVLDDKESENITNDVQAKVENGEIWVDVQNKPKPVIHKGVRKIRNQDAGYDGDEIQTWVVNANVPVGIGDYTKYVIADEIDYEKTNVADKRLEFVGLDSVEVSLLNDYEGTKDRDLVAGTDYELNFNAETKILTITFINVNDEDEGFKGGRNLPEGKIIDIKYKTKFRLDENGQIIGLQQSIKNKATLTFGVKDTVDTAESETPEVHTGAVGVYKYEDLNKNGRYDEGEPALVGAHFKIARSKEEANRAVTAILNGDTNTLSEINFVKVRAEDGSETNDDVELITEQNGKATYQGLAFGGDAQKNGVQPSSDGKDGFQIYKYTDTWDNVSTKYYLVETQAPDGYYLLENAEEFTVSMNSYEEINLNKYYKIANYPKIYDLSLRKFITHVNGDNVDKEITDRIPKVTLTEEFKDPMNDEVTTAIYEHTKNPVIVQQGNIVTYTIRIYNEGTEDSYASIVKDDIPDGVELVQYKKGDGSINDEYGWKLVDENDNEVTDASKAKFIVTDYLSMEKGKIKKDGTNSNLIRGFNRKTMDELDYRDIKVQFRVTEPNTSERILVNYAQIAKETDSEGNVVVDRDSTPNEWVEGEDDQDIEKVKLLYFDLALRKWVTKAKVTQDGKETIFETGHKAEDDPEDVVKVDLKKSKLDKVVVKFEYQIRITNEGRIGGWADEITDYIPDGLTFDQADNPTWTQLDDKTIVTDELKNTYLNPGESAEVTMVLRWINSGTNLGLKVNVAEISKDRNEYNVHDVDSTPGNYVWGEDDIDDAPVMLAVKTGNTVLAYTMIALVAISIITIGALKIRDGLKN